MNKEHIEVIVTSIKPSGRGNLLFEVSKPDDGQLPCFDAGAHIDVHLKNGLVRQYSLCGTIGSKDYQFCIRLDAGSKGGATHMHNNVNVGDHLIISHPRNHFQLPFAEKYLLFAGGIGITPLLAMAETIADKGVAFELHYYAANKEDMALTDRLDSTLLGENVFLHESANGDSLRNNLPLCLLQPHEKTVILACGPFGFMRHIKDTAERNGWRASQYHCEQFQNEVVSSIGAKEVFSVQIASTGQTFQVVHDKTIAEVLSENGVAVDLSCEQGICGACLTKVLSGIPDHCDVVQSDAEKALNNFMTLCCSRSKSELLILDL